MMLLTTVRKTPVTLSIFWDHSHLEIIYCFLFYYQTLQCSSGPAELGWSHLENSRKHHWDLNSQWFLCWNSVVLRSSCLFSLVLAG